MRIYREEDEKSIASLSMNVFANDGSFLDQFKKIANKTTGRQETQQDKPEDKKKDEKNFEAREKDKERKRDEEKNRDWDSRRDRRRNDSRWGRNLDRKHSSSSSPSPTRRRSSPSPETRRSYNQSQNGQHAQFNQFPIQSNNHASSIPSLMSQSVQMQMTNIPPPNIRNLTPSVSSAHLQRIPVSKNFNNYTNISDHSNNVRMQIAPPHIIRPALPIQTIPPNTNIPPPNMQLSQSMPMSNLSSSSNGQQHIIQNSQQCNIPPPSCSTNLQHPNIPPPNIPPPNILPSMSQMPPTMIPITGSQAIVVTVPSVANVPPPNVITSMIMSAPPPVHTVPSTINSVPPPNLNIPPPNVPPPTVIPNTASSRGLVPTGYVLSNQVSISVGPPNIQIPPPVRPPTNLQSPEQQVCLVEAEQLARIVADCGDEIEQEVREKNAQDPKLW